ncbi:response regulator receiver [groundwater metagenome]
MNDSKPRILVVDDDLMNVELLEGMLSKDYDVATAYDGKEALLKVETTFPDLILLDIMIPGMDGYEVCRKLKGDEKTKSIPIVMVTALKEKEDRISL